MSLFQIQNIPKGIKGKDIPDRHEGSLNPRNLFARRWKGRFGQQNAIAMGARLNSL